MTHLRLAERGAFGCRTLAFVNRCRSQGIGIGESMGDFLIDEKAATVVTAAGFTPEAGDYGSVPLHASSPRIAIYAGDAVGYPYWGYYAHALLSIGLHFHALTGAEIIAGKLPDYDLLIMPGGFATWGLDRAEGIIGIDAAIDAYIRMGGAYIGSCGGAFYVSEGRPGWLEAIDATPKYTQEYLLTGAGVLGFSLNEQVIGNGLPEIVELLYYHGPVYADEPRLAETLGYFRNFISESRLFIENPLSATFFDKQMKATPAIFTARLGEGKVLAFSPHPEMGEFVRKGIALDSYIPRFAPIRGFKVMDQTLRFYMKENCAGFRLIHNAIASLGLFEKQKSAEPATEKYALDVFIETLTSLDKKIAHMSGQLDHLAAQEPDLVRDIAKAEIERVQDEGRRVMYALRQACENKQIDMQLLPGLSAVLQEAERTSLDNLRLAELLVMTELPIRIMAAALRIIECDGFLETAQ